MLRSALVGALLLGGCSIKMIPTRDLSLARPSAVEEVETSILFKHLVDERGNELRHNSPVSFIPGPNLFYTSSTNRYPDLTAVLVGFDGDRTTTVVGNLGRAMPFLLEEQIRDSRLTTNTAVLEQLGYTRRPNDFDYIVEGRMVRSDVRTEANPIPLGVLSFFGAPFIFATGHLSVELDIRETATNQVVFTKTYDWSGKRAAGLYYNLGYARSLLEAGLEDIVHQAVDDIFDTVRKGMSNRPPATPDTPAPPPPAEIR